MKYLRSLLNVDGARRVSWRRLFVVVSLQTFGAFALWYGKLDGATWAWFAAGLASAYIGGDTAEKFAKIKGAGADAVVTPESLGLGLGLGPE